MTNFLNRHNIPIIEDFLDDLHPSDVHRYTKLSKKTSADALSAKFYNSDLKEIVRELYKKDFKELGYDDAC